MKTFAERENKPQQKSFANLATNTPASAQSYEEHPLLNLQSTIGNQAVLRSLQGNRGPTQSGQQAAGSMLLQRKDSAAGGSSPKASSGPHGKSDQEQSWANPMRLLSTEPALVGVIYFRTKESLIDAQDEAVLLQLAKAYAPWAERNVGTKGGERGLRGRIVGYADPRPSVEPNNIELSAQRAAIVERQLTRFLVQETTSLIVGDFEFKKEAGGVAPPDPDARGAAEEVSLGWQRRVEIYIAGQASEPVTTDVPAPAPVPDQQKHPDDWDRWMPEIRACHAEFAKGQALQILGFLLSSPLRKVFGYTGTIPLLVPLPGVRRGPAPSSGVSISGISYGKHGGVLPFTPKKPPWWDARTSGYSNPSLGRQALSPHAVKCDTLLRATQLMIRDMRELNRYIDLTVENQNSAYLKFMAEMRKDEPDVAKLREYAVPIEYLMFMWDALLDKANEVSRFADFVEAE